MSRPRRELSVAGGKLSQFTKRVEKIRIGFNLLSRYIHLNPVRAKMVEAPEDYAWSSYQYYIGLKNPPEWLTRNFILGYFNKNISAAQMKYHGFVSELVNRKYDSPLAETANSTLLAIKKLVRNSDLTMNISALFSAF